MSDTYVVTEVNGVTIPTILKDPNAVLDYIIDWTTWLDDVPDTISSASVVTPVGITCNSSSISGKMVIMWISGGTAGVTYQVACRIVTVGGRTDDRSIYLKIVER